MAALIDIDIENRTRTCPGCKKLAVGESGGLVVAFGQSFFHVDCFKCAKCNNQVPVDTNLLLLPDDSPICAECSYNCSICQLPILDEAMITGDSSYHVHCFQCKVCHNRIDGSVFAKTSHGIYCMNCHNERMAKIRRHAQRKREQEKATRDREARDPIPENALSERPKTPAHVLCDAPFTQSLHVSALASPPTQKSRSASPEQSQSFVTTVARTTNSAPLSHLPPTYQKPGIQVDAVECFQQTTSKLREELNLHDERHDRALDFKRRLPKKLERLGDMAVDVQRYDEAISHYTTALSSNPPFSQDIFVKRSKAFLSMGSWKQALDDANRAITLDPSSPCGYEVKHAALHKAGDYDNAIHVFEVMLLKMAESPDPEVQQHGDQYISPSSTRAAIRKIVQRTIRHLPRVLINTTTGRLHDRAEHASTFEALPIFNELVSSTRTRIDYARIKHEVRQYFRYVMLSHKWEDNEPLFQQVVHMAVYDLDKSPTHDKLQTFCKIVRDAGFNWAWSDTCCINKSDHFILQEALVAMFKWYQGSAVMIVFLRGVRSPSQRGALVDSIWNTRAWTLQEYVASKVICFYTEDWTLYLDLELPNHKESPEVISEMEHATGMSAQQLMAIRPGLTSIREKLRLASTRQTTLVEDAAYSLLGIFSITGIPAIYGEGEGSLGRLLAHILAGSGDVSILAWTGESGSFNSCLPAHITVFKGPATTHLPPPIPDAEMERILTASHLSSFDLDVALRLYDRLDELPAPWFAASRMKLPCIAFQLPSLSPYRTRSGRVYRAGTIVFGMVEIKTRQDLSRMKSLYLVHPWLETILGREEEAHSGAFFEDDVVPPPSLHMDDEEVSDEEVNDDFSSLRELKSLSLHDPRRMSPLDKEMRARRLVARLRQPFGALLVTLATSGRRAVDYRRVATDCLITVQIQEHIPLADLLDNVRTFDVL